jgi:hypothetical protein
MKAKYTQIIDRQPIVTAVQKISPDPEATKRKITPMIKPGMKEKDIERLYNENPVYRVGQEAELISDEEGDQVQEKLKKRGMNRLLHKNGKYVVDYRNIEYWRNNKKSGKWLKEKIEHIEIELPADAVLQENLTQEQQEEIAAQKRAEEIAAMTPEKKAEMEKAELDAVADEADRLARRAEIQGKTFDPKAWYKEQVKSVIAKFA